DLRRRVGGTARRSAVRRVCAGAPRHARRSDGRAQGGINMLISLRNVEKSYPIGVGRTYVLRRVNLDIKEGEFVSIMGPSGAGKSTVLHILGMHDSSW